jgi:hypothetical protein
MNEAATSSQITPRGLEFADRLERLLQLPLDSATDVESWQEACGELREWIDANFSELPLRLPQYLMFYFHDPDIRAKEPKYRNHQEQQVRRFIRQLRGEEPPDIKRPWWRFW